MTKFITALALVSIGFGCNNTKTDTISENKTEVKDTVTTTTLKNTVSNTPSKESLSQYFTVDGDWVQIKNALSSDQTGIYVYFQNTNEVARNLRMRIQYGDQNTYKFVIDGKSFTYNANRSQESDNRFIEGSSLTWYDNDVRNKDYKFLNTLADAKNAKIILNDGTSFSINDDTKKGIKRTFDYFESLDGLLPKTNMVNIRR